MCVFPRQRSDVQRDACGAEDDSFPPSATERYLKAFGEVTQTISHLCSGMTPPEREEEEKKQLQCVLNQGSMLTWQEMCLKWWPRKVFIERGSHFEFEGRGVEAYFLCELKADKEAEKVEKIFVFPSLPPHSVGGCSTCSVNLVCSSDEERDEDEETDPKMKSEDDLLVFTEHMTQISCSVILLQSVCTNRTISKVLLDLHSHTRPESKHRQTFLMPSRSSWVGLNAWSTSQYHYSTTKPLYLLVVMLTMCCWSSCSRFSTSGV